MKTTRIFWSIMIMLVVASMLFVACAPAAPEEPMEEPAAEEPAAEEPAAEEPAAEEPAAEEPAAGPKTLTVAVGSESYHIRGWSIDTDDAFSMSYDGILETLVKVDYDGNMVPSLAEGIRLRSSGPSFALKSPELSTLKRSLSPSSPYLPPIWHL